MEKISVFNYEAFYLDYLEGNLNEADTALLMTFFKNHPECRLDEDELPIVSVNDEIVYQAKNELKMVDGSEVITMDNYRDFMIQSTEGIILADKQVELTAFIAEHNLEGEMNRFAAVYYQPDEHIVFTDKAGLKHKTTIILWPYISAVAVAACLILLFTIWNSNNSGEMPTTNTTIAKKTEGVELTPEKGLQTIENVTEPITIADNSSSTTAILNQKKRVEDQSVTTIKSNASRPILSELVDRKLEPITLRSYPEIQPEMIETEPQDYASTGFNGMQNPIEPITKLISDKTNTDVDFRRAKPTGKKPGGFYVKVGKFELSHKKH